MGSRSNTSHDDDIIELAVSLRGLQISIRGPARVATESLSQITGALAGQSGLSSAAPGSPNSSALDFEPSAVSAVSTVGSETRADIQATFPLCTSYWISQAHRLGGERSAVEGRLRRAWLAGCWARAVLDGRVATPARSVQLEVRPRYYVVLRCEGVDCPVVFESSASYWRAIRNFAGSNSVSHSFPSQTEARAYLDAAGFGNQSPRFEA